MLPNNGPTYVEESNLKTYLVLVLILAAFTAALGGASVAVYVLYDSFCPIS